MRFSNLKTLLCLTFVSLLPVLTTSCVGDSNGVIDIPSLVLTDSANSRVYAIDSEDNGIYRINSDDNKVFKDKPLLDEEKGPILLPAFPKHAALASLPNAVSRIFVSGIDSPNPSNRIIVLDDDAVAGLRRASFSPITVGGSSEDILSGMTLDTVHGLLFVSNASSGKVHVFDVNSGAEVVDSPVTIPGAPARLSFDANLNKITVVDAASTLVYWIDPTHLSDPLLSFDTGLALRDAATATNAQGSLLFVSGNAQNLVRVFKLNFADLPTSILLSEILPPPADQTFSEDSLISGTLNQVAAGVLTDDQLAGFVTQSSGDFLILHADDNLSKISSLAVKVGAVSGEDIDFLRNADGQVTTVYYASPGVGTLTLINPLTNEFLGQIN